MHMLRQPRPIARSHVWFKLYLRANVDAVAAMSPPAPLLPMNFLAPLLRVSQALVADYY
jgi:hypothetical protein